MFFSPNKKFITSSAAVRHLDVVSDEPHSLNEWPPKLDPV